MIFGAGPRGACPLHPLPAAYLPHTRTRTRTRTHTRYKALEEELVRLHDPNATTPRRTEMRNKLVAYDQAFSVRGKA